MASSAANLRRLMCRSGADAYTNLSRSWRGLAANRMMSTSGGGVSSSESAAARAPWIILPPTDAGSGNRFYSQAKKEIHSSGAWRVDSDLKMVGSSHGWVVLYNPQSHDLSLTDPMSERVINLPPVPEDTFVNTVVLSSENQGEGEGGLAFMNFGPRGRLAFCSPGRSKEWSLFDVGEKRVYDNMVYSSRHKRLFCITEENSRLEGWDVGDDDDHQPQPPRLEWSMDIDPNVVPYPFNVTLESNKKELTYIVCDEHTGDLFFVKRTLNLRVDLGGYWVDRKVFCEYIGPACRAPYETWVFWMYKIDRKRGKLFEGNLGGLAMFVGINHSLAIPATGVPGLTPNAIYFSYDNRIKIPHNSNSSLGGQDFGIYDCGPGRVRASPLSTFSNLSRVDLDYPVWFTPMTSK